MDKAAKVILNLLKCPVCGSQIDIIYTRNKAYNCSCVSNPSEYQIDFDYESIPPHIEKECVVVYEGSHQYEVRQIHSSYAPLLNKTEITIRDVDPEHRIIHPSKMKIFMFEKLMFDFSHTNREKLVNRIKTILVFQ